MALPGIPSAVGQLINGQRYDFSSIEANFGPSSFTNFQAISYSDTLEPGIQRGQSSKKLGRTRGEYNATGSITLLKEDVPTLLAALAALGQGGYMEAVWDLTATYSGGLTDLVPTVDALIGMRITEIGDDHSIGSDVLVNELTLDIMEITRGGLSATAGGSSLAGVGASIGGILGGNL
ncbi:MAG: hypothetical protein HRT76_14765 [Halieaceae bacterium]|nr:hypothetical protein [Halieaceae bacterium]